MNYPKCNHKEYDQSCDECKSNIERERINQEIEHILEVIVPIYKEQGLTGIARHIHSMQPKTGEGK